MFRAASMGVSEGEQGRYGGDRRAANVSFPLECGDILEGRA